MKKLPTNKKLTLHAQTLKNLTTNQLAAVNGGGRVSGVYCYVSDLTTVSGGTIGTICPND
jgi:bacteriocin-like protein